MSSDPANGRFCDTLTAASGWSLSVRLWTLIIYFTVFVYSVRLLVRDIRKSGC